MVTNVPMPAEKSSIETSEQVKEEVALNAAEDEDVRRMEKKLVRKLDMVSDDGVTVQIMS